MGHSRVIVEVIEGDVSGPTKFMRTLSGWDIRASKLSLSIDGLPAEARKVSVALPCKHHIVKFHVSAAALQAKAVQFKNPCLVNCAAAPPAPPPASIPEYWWVLLAPAAILLVGLAGGSYLEWWG